MIMRQVGGKLRAFTRGGSGPKNQGGSKNKWRAPKCLGAMPIQGQQSVLTINTNLYNYKYPYRHSLH